MPILLDSASGVSQRIITLRLKVGILAHVEAGASLVAEGVVTYDKSIGIVFLQVFQQLAHRLFLFWSTGVGRLAVSIQSAFIADADGVLVVLVAVCSHHLQWATVLHRAVTTYHIVIAATILPSASQMPLVDLLNAACLEGHHSRAVQNKKSYQSHISSFLCRFIRHRNYLHDHQKSFHCLTVDC